MNVLSRCKEFPELFHRRLKDALATIFFYILQFLLVYALFGSRYAMVVSGTTTLFQINRRHRNEAGDYLRLFLVPIVLCLLASAATRTLTLCILLNFGVTFFLVVWKSSQFQPKGYMGFAMTFIFLELCPSGPDELLRQMEAVVFCHILLMLALVLYGRRHRPADPAAQIRKNVHRLSQLLDQLAEGTGGETIQKEFYEIAQSFHRMGYDRRHLLPLPDRQKEVYHLFALLCQRASYLISDESWGESRNLPAFPQAMRTLADLVRQYEAVNEFPEKRAVLRRRIQALLDDTGLPKGRLRIFYRSVLHILQLLCRDEDFAPETSLWRRRAWRESWHEFQRKFSSNRVEFRFALQMAVVMTISCTISFLWDFEHTYWFPLHAFLLLQPSYEDSAHRIWTRPVGTAIGCVLVHLTFPYLPGLVGVFAFSLFMISLMYCCTPGSWVHPIFSTAFALTMTSLTVERVEAIWLRLMYLGMAVVLVLFVSRFLLPNRKELQFYSNLRELLRLQAVYWDMVRRSLRLPLEPAVLSELLAEFHMIHREASLFSEKLPEAEKFRMVLVTLWAMFSELEQVECLIQSKAIRSEEYEALGRVAQALCERVSPLQESIADLPLEEIDQEDLKCLLERYLQNARTLCEYGCDWSME